MLFRVRLARMLTVFLSLRRMTVHGVSVVRRFFVIASIVMFRRFRMMLCGVGMVFGGLRWCSAVSWTFRFSLNMAGKLRQ